MESEPFNWKFWEIQINNPNKTEIPGKKFRYTLQGVYSFPKFCKILFHWSLEIVFIEMESAPRLTEEKFSHI